MKFKGLTIFALLALSCSTQRVADGNYHLSIYSTNDLHGRFFDSLYTSKGVQNASLSRVVGYVNRVRDTAAIKPIFIDAGDHLQGDNATFYFNFIDTTGKHLFSRIAEYSGYDAIVVGNHDIETGHKVYDKIKSEMKVPYLAANAINLKTGQPWFKPYTVIKRGKIKIAVLGMTNPNISNWLSNDLWSGIEFKEIIEPSRYWIERIKKEEKPHIILLVTHTGIGDGSPSSPENASKYAASTLPDINAVFAAHDHQTYYQLVKNGNREIPLIESGSRAQALSKINLSVQFLKGKIVKIESSGENVSMANEPGSKEFNSKFQNDFNKVKLFTNKEIGELKTDLSSRNTYFGTSNYLNLIHKVQLSATGAQISFAAPLTFDLNIKRGKINYQDLLSIYPFENQLYVMNLTGEEIKGYLEYSYSTWVKTMKNESDDMLNIRKRGDSGRYSFASPTYNFDSAFGIEYTVDLRKEIGDRVHIVSMSDGSAFDLNKTYKVAITSYRASGGGDLLEKGSGLDKGERENRIVAKYPEIRELIYDYISSGKSLNIEDENWKFIPEDFLDNAKKREYPLIFPLLTH